MRRHYRSRQNRLTLGQSVSAASKRVSELAKKDNSHEGCLGREEV